MKFWDVLGRDRQTNACIDYFKDEENGFGNPDIVKIQNSMKKSKCPLPKISCECCAGRYMGKWEVNNNKIIICANSVAPRGQLRPEVIKEVIHHEYIHAWQACKKMPGWGRSSIDMNCKNNICGEIQAYYWSRCRHLDDPEKCLVDRVPGSAREHCTNGEDMDAMIKKMWKKCVSWKPE